MACLFCLKETNDGISLNGASDLAEHARNIIAKHFWFDINEINSAERYACSICWPKVEQFHEFYILVESNHQNNSTDIVDAKISANPLFYCEPKIITDTNATTVKIENDRFSSNYEAIYIPSTTYWDDSDKPIDSSHKTEKRSNTLKQINDSNATLPANQGNASLDSNKEEELQMKSAAKAKTVSKKETKKKKKKLTTNTKTISNESETKSNIQVKEAIITVDGVICYLCHKPFSSLRGVRKHLHVHDPIESQIYECDLCGKSFSRLSVIREHMRYHQNRKKYNKHLDKGLSKTPCPICQKEITSKNLKSHISIMHENKKSKTLMCEVCGKGFSAPSLLAQHALTHVDFTESKVQCDICSKWVKNQGILRTHKLTHVQTPLKCPHCDKIKFNERALRSHISQSHAPPKHECTICHKLFARPLMLKEHVATHTGTALYTCPYGCSQTFKCNSNKYKHLKLRHLNEWMLDRKKNNIK